MSFRILTNPPLAAMPPLVERPDGISPAVSAAVVAAPGVEPLRTRLALPGALTVTTGQQPALFLGPLYTLHKALSAAALAGLLEARWGRPVIPVFWVAGDDHDWDEARSAHWLDEQGEVMTAALRQRDPDAPMLPLWREPLGSEVARAVQMFRRSHHESAAGSAAVDLLQRHFRPEASISSATCGMLAELLAPFGVLVLDSTHPEFKRAAAPLLTRAVRDSEVLSRRIVERGAALLARGWDPGVEHDENATLVMLDGPEGRDRLVRYGKDQFQLRRAGHRFSAADLDRIAVEEPQRLSANVLLRPVLESQLLATVGYCAGPGELRYLALAGAVFETLDVARPAAVPRWSGLIVDSYADRMLERFDLPLDALRDPRQDVLARAAAARMPPRAVEALRQLRQAATDGFEIMADEAARISPPLARSVEGSERRVAFEYGRLERRLVRSLKRRHETELRQLARARTSVLPVGRPQERILCVAGPLARFGPALLDTVLQAAAASYRSALEGPLVPA
jgi:bacillithiol biosynthesis cysteine-adding enzyme BshC